MGSFVIDAFEFCRQQERREGETPVSGFSRLTEESLGKTGVIRWSVRGDHDKLGHPQLHLAVAGEVELTCQRCLQPFAYAVQSESVLVLAANEDEADRIEELVDEAFDVIVATQQLDLAALIEDEALLTIPLSPRHEACPGRQEMKEEAKQASPFSVLKNWKQ